MRFLVLLRIAMIVGFFLQILGVIYGVAVLKRIKAEQRMLTQVLSAFSDRSEKIAEAITSLRLKE